MPSIITDEVLRTLGIEVPEFARNQNARIVEEETGDEDLPRFKCRCGQNFRCLSSFIVRCSEHLGVSSSLLKISKEVSREPDGEPLMNVRKVRKRIQVVGSLKNHHFECSDCRVWFTERYKYNDHMACHANPLLKCCEICMTQFSSGIRARKHIAKFHPELKRQKQESQPAQEPADEVEKMPNTEPMYELECEMEVDKASSEEVYEEIEYLEEEEVQISTETTPRKKSRATAAPKKPRRKRRKLEENEYRMPSREQKECPICKTLVWPCNLKKHIARHNAFEEDVKCPECGEEFQNNAKVRHHFKSHHRKDWFEAIRESCKKNEWEGIRCLVCFTPLKEDTHLEVHMEIVHGSQRTYQRTTSECRVCHKIFYNATNRRLHEERIHHGEEIPVAADEFICDMCGSTFQYKGHLIQHFRKHMAPREYTEQTKRKYYVAARDKKEPKEGSTKRFRSEFVKSATGAVELIYFCSVCGQQFKSRNETVDHIKIIHPRGNRSFICEHCGFITDTKYNLQVHLNSSHEVHIPELMKTLEGKRAADNQKCTCQVCGREFTSIVKCKAHEKYHEKVRDDIVCPICGVKVRTQAYLRDHLKRHQEKTISCPYDDCEQKFAVQQNLQLHIKRMHLQAEEFRCRYCPNVYKSWNGRCYHEFKFHDGPKWRGHYKIPEKTESEAIEFEVLL